MRRRQAVRECGTDKYKGSTHAAGRQCGGGQTNTGGPHKQHAHRHHTRAALGRQVQAQAVCTRLSKFFCAAKRAHTHTYTHIHTHKCLKACPAWAPACLGTRMAGHPHAWAPTAGPHSSSLVLYCLPLVEPTYLTVDFKPSWCPQTLHSICCLPTHTATQPLPSPPCVLHCCSPCGLLPPSSPRSQTHLRPPVLQLLLPAHPRSYAVHTTVKRA